MSPHNRKPSSERKLSPAQKIAAKIKEKIGLFDSAGAYTDPHLAGCEDLYLSSDNALIAIYGEQHAELSDEERNAKRSEYNRNYKQDDLVVDMALRLPNKHDYIVYKLIGITEGKITSGDGHLGAEINAFLDIMDGLIAEQRDKIKPELAKAYECHCKEIETLVHEGATLGLFTSGQSIAPERTKGHAGAVTAGRDGHVPATGR